MSRSTDHASVLRWLQARSEQLRLEIAAARPVHERTREVGDFKDEAAEAATMAVADAEVERDRAELRRVEHAQARVRQGCYGSCEDCGESIDEARLHALPASTRCLACQRAVERMGSQLAGA